MKFKQNKSILLIPAIILFIITITIPTFLMSSDIWDGTIIEYASRINDYNGLYSFFIESHWYLQYPLSVAIIKIANLFLISYKDCNSIFMLLIMIFIFNEISILVQKLYNFNCSVCIN